MPTFIAPNGNRSNLIGIKAEDENGKWVYLYDLVRSNKFKEFFGDWEEAYITKDYDYVSKIIDENGEPSICYHTTSNEFFEFSENFIGSRTDAGYYGKGFYFTEGTPDSHYGEKEIPCFLNIRNPYLKQSSYRNYELNSDDLKSKGFDGVIVFSDIENIDLTKGLGYRGNRVEEIVAYYPEQIKLADATNTTFDRYDSDIRYGGGGKIKKNEDEDRIEISLKNIGKVILVITYPRYEFSEDVGEDGLIELGIDEDDMIGKIEHIEIEDEYKGKGYAKILMNKAIEIAKERGLMPLYLNASPMGFKGLRLNDLTAFYESFGFEIFLSQGNNNLMILKDEYKKGGKVRLSKTPAPKSERIYGSKVNKPKSSASKSKASSIILSPKVITSINTILEKHNEKSNKKIPLATAKAVVRRGMGAYSSTHRPTISGGKPNSRVAWGLARLNAFVYKIQKGYSKSGKYIQDDDLINELGYKVKKYDIGGIFQGTPHDFNVYSTEYAGTGEGNQSFGWGLYFTDQKTIAERYAYIPSENTFYIDGVSLKDSIQFTQEQKNIILNIWRDLWQMGYAKTSDDYLFEIINEIEQKSILLDINDESVFDKETILEINQDAKIYYDLYEKLKKSQIEIKSNIVGITLFKGKNPYEYNIIEWENPIGEYNAKIIYNILTSDLKRMWGLRESPNAYGQGYGDYRDLMDYNGRYLYQALSNLLGDDKKASMFLLRAGIDGIKYKSGTLSGFTDKEGYNYVIFNADDVTIEQKEKYESGGNIEFEYKLNEVYPNIFLLEMYDQYDLASCFVRCQAFYEWDNFRGKDFKIQDFHNSYAKTYPQLKPYQKEFYGFNLPSDVIRNCYQVNKERNNYDNLFLEVISKIKKDNYYLIGVVEGDTTTLNHELAHAFFWADKSYRDDMTKLVNEIPNKNELLKILKEERGYGENVLIDEAQAFLSTGLIVNISDWQKYKKPFEDRFERQKNHNFEEGGELTITSEQVEQKLERKLHWWNDDIVSINGIEYKKVFLKNEYKKV